MKDKEKASRGTELVVKMIQRNLMCQEAMRGVKAQPEARVRELVLAAERAYQWLLNTQMAVPLDLTSKLKAVLAQFEVEEGEDDSQSANSVL